MVNMSEREKSLVTAKPVNRRFVHLLHVQITSSTFLHKGFHGKWYTLLVDSLYKCIHISLQCICFWFEMFINVFEFIVLCVFIEKATGIVGSRQWYVNYSCQNAVSECRF
jgi:hypothetical protein